MSLKKWEEIWGSEWDYVKRLGACLHDPEEKKAFWETLKAKKLADAKYSIYDDYPRAEGITRKAMHDCCEFVRSLRRHKPEGNTL